MMPMTNVNLALHFFLQIAAILVVCRLVGIVARRLGQPQVVAEMISGVCLGPSLFGLFLPEWQTYLFPWDATQKTRDTSCYLYPISQLGLSLYMFIVGMEFRLDIVRKNFRTSLAVSIAGMVTPFVLGLGLAYYLYYNTKMFPESTGQFEAMMFLGASMCITAFPMLARIIHFKGLTGTRIGTVALGSGAIDDAGAWCLLAIVLSSIDHNLLNAVWSIAGGITFVGVSVLVVRPILTQAEHWFVDSEDRLTDAGVVFGFLCMAICSWITEKLQLHAVLGAFVIGTSMPRRVMCRDLIARIQPLTVALLLPLFFAYSGLNTKIGLLNSPYLWGICGLILVTAIVGKFVACWLAARASGIPNREALGIGVLMNSRGLMELIIINIGLQRDIISQELFATLVIMAVTTTLMASPVFDWLMPSNKAAT